MEKNNSAKITGKLQLQDGTVFTGNVFGFPKSTAGEVVFNTGMVGYPETFSDPSYHGQILTMTYPLVGNYGIPALEKDKSPFHNFESDKAQLQALIVSEVSGEYDHWNSNESLSDWLFENQVPALSGIDTRKLTKLLRESGTMLGKIIIDGDVDYYDPDKDDLISKVTIKEVRRIGKGNKKVLLIDCGCKNSIAKSLAERNVEVIRVPWHYNIDELEFDAVLFSNGPGNPEVYTELVEKAKKILEKKIPTLGICLGHQIIALASGLKTEKLKYGHRSQNQPVKETTTEKCFVTSQNHGFHVVTKKLPEGWNSWFENLNDGTNEGLKHKSLPFMSVQFHPEAAPGPVDTAFIFDEFIRMIK